MSGFNHFDPDFYDDDLRVIYGPDEMDYIDDYYDDDDDDYYDDGQPDWTQRWEELADAGYGTEEDYGYYGDQEPLEGEW